RQRRRVAALLLGALTALPLQILACGGDLRPERLELGRSLTGRGVALLLERANPGLIGHRLRLLGEEAPGHLGRPAALGRDVLASVGELAFELARPFVMAGEPGL